MNRAELFEEYARLIEQDWHEIEFTDNGWTIAHPLVERLDGSLFDCNVSWANGDPGVRGRFLLNNDNTLSHLRSEN